MKRKLKFVALGVAMAVGLCACGKKTDAGNDGDGEISTTEVSATEEQLPEAEVKTVDALNSVHFMKLALYDQKNGKFISYTIMKDSAYDAPDDKYFFIKLEGDLSSGDYTMPDDSLDVNKDITQADVDKFIDYFNNNIAMNFPAGTSSHIINFTDDGTEEDYKKVEIYIEPSSNIDEAYTGIIMDSERVPDWVAGFEDLYKSYLD